MRERERKKRRILALSDQREKIMRLEQIHPTKDNANKKPVYIIVVICYTAPWRQQGFPCIHFLLLSTSKVTYPPGKSLGPVMLVFIILSFFSLKSNFNDAMIHWATLKLNNFL